MGNKGRVVLLLLAACCLMAAAANCVVAGDAARPVGNIKVLCEKANAVTEARLQTLAGIWRQSVADLRTLPRLRRIASDAVAFEEKVAQGTSLFDTRTSRTDRMRQSFRKHVVDERVHAKLMSDAFGSWQNELITATVTLYGNVGISKAAAQNAFPTVKFDSVPLERAFDPVVRKANTMATEDWFRFALVNAGSDLVAEGVEEFGRSTGTWNAEEGSFGDFFAGLLLQVASDVVLDSITDPTEQFAKELQIRMVTAERDLLDGPSGLITAMRNLATFHQNSRLNHLGLTTKGVLK
jgi:hypothetical protein